MRKILGMFRITFYGAHYSFSQPNNPSRKAREGKGREGKGRGGKGREGSWIVLVGRIFFPHA